MFKTLHPNNGLRSYTRFDETVRLAMHYDIPFDKTIQNVVALLQAHTSACVDTEKVKKLVFLTRQLELLLQKQFSMNDCFCFQSYPKCNYEQLRDFLVLPCKRKLQYITSCTVKTSVKPGWLTNRCGLIRFDLDSPLVNQCSLFSRSVRIYAFVRL
ncbi:hypothetical protein FHG87_017496 [Trinorchestia longiramus]|nr:hypothetical protein FHG87_017496 [Trinorchestia longiramus]